MRCLATRYVITFCPPWCSVFYTVVFNLFLFLGCHLWPFSFCFSSF
jgi:hypothetical protein